MFGNLQFWLSCEQSPNSLYQLLGRPLLDPDREALAQSAAKAYRELHVLQTNRDLRIAQRARQLQDLVAQGTASLASSTQWDAYEREQINRVVQMFHDRAAQFRQPRRDEQIVSWLRDELHLHPARINQVRDAVLAASPVETPGQPTAAGAPVEQQGFQLFSQPPKLPSAPPPIAPGATFKKSAPPAALPPTVPSAAAPPPRRAEPPPRVARAPAASAFPVPTGVLPSHRGPGSVVTSPPEGFGPLGGMVRPTTERTSLGAAGTSSVAWVIAPAIVTGLVLSIAFAVFLVPKFRQASSDPSPESVTQAAPPNRSASPPLLPEDAPDSTAPGGRNTRPVPLAQSSPLSGRGVAPNPPGPAAANSTEPSGEPSPAAPLAATSPPPGAAESPAAQASTTPRPTAPQPTAETPASGSTTSASNSSPAATSASAAEAAEFVIQHTRPVTVAAWSPDGQRIATAGDDAGIQLTHAVTGQTEFKLSGHTDSVSDLAWNPDGKRLASCGADGTVRIWDTETRTQAGSFTGEGSGTACALTWLSNKTQLVTGDTAGSVSIIATERLNATPSVLEFGTLAGPIRTLSTSTGRAGEWLAAVHLDGSVLAWSPGSKKLLRLLCPAEGRVARALDEDASQRRQLRDAAVTPINSQEANDVAVSPDGKRLAVANCDVSVWDITNSDTTFPVLVIPGRAGAEGYRAVAWSPDGNYLAAGDGTGRVHCWEAGRWKIVAQWSCQSRVNWLGWSPRDKNRLAFASDDANVRIVKLGPSEDRVALDPPADFPVAEVLSQAEEFLEGGEMVMLRRAVDLLSSYRLNSVTAEALQKYQLALREASEQQFQDAQPDLEDSGRDTRSSRAAAAGLTPPGGQPSPSGQRESPDSAWQRWVSLQAALQEVIYLEPGSPSSERARAALKDLGRKSNSRR